MIAELLPPNPNYVWPPSKGFISTRKMVHSIIIWFLMISLPCEYKISEVVRFGRDLICKPSVSEIPKPPEEKKIQYKHETVMVPCLQKLMPYYND